MTASYLGYQEATSLWVNNESKTMDFTLDAGIELSTVVITYVKPLIEQEMCSCGCGYWGCGTQCFGLLPNNADPLAIEASISAFDAEKITIYPNPFISTLTIEMEVKTAQPYLFHLYNEAGQLVFAESRELEAGQQNFQLDLVQRHLPEGAYFLRISDDAGEIRTKRLVKVSP